LLTEYVLFTLFILITLLHNDMRKFGTFFMRHPVLLWWADIQKLWSFVQM